MNTCSRRSLSPSLFYLLVGLNNYVCAGDVSFKLDKHRFNFKELVEECVSSVQLTSPAHTIIIEANQQIEYDGDRLRLEQVFTNFLNNAVKYSPEAHTIIVRSDIQLNNIVVSIQDFGIGIEKKICIKYSTGFTGLITRLQNSRGWD